MYNFPVVLKIILQGILYCILGIAILGIGLKKQQTANYNEGCSHL
jgi:hypothetical protein